MKRTAPPRRAASRAPVGRETPASTTDRLLDTAELLFARRGYRGTSVRAITTLAGCNLAAVNYHFDGKIGLYERMFERLLVRLRARREDDLRRTLERLGPDAGLETFLRAFTAAFLEPHLEESAGGRRLMQLFLRELLDPHLDPGTLRRELVRPVRESLMRAMAAIGVNVSGRSGRRCMESLLGQLLHVVRMRQAPHVTGNAGREDFELRGMIDHIARFTAAGVRACVAPERSR